MQPLVILIWFFVITRIYIMMLQMVPVSTLTVSESGLPILDWKETNGTKSYGLLESIIYSKISWVYIAFLLNT